jgi:ketosteroid isomerase-like protein
MRFAGLLGGAVPQVRAWAGDDALVLIEWQVDVPTPSGAAYALGMVDRFDLAAGRALAARTYFDASSLARALALPQAVAQSRSEK